MGAFYSPLGCFCHSIFSEGEMEVEVELTLRRLSRDQLNVNDGNVKDGKSVIFT